MGDAEDRYRKALFAIIINVIRRNVEGMASKNFSSHFLKKKLMTCEKSPGHQQHHIFYLCFN